MGEVTEVGLPDHTALDPKSDYFDPKATKDRNPWVSIRVNFKEKFPRIVTLEEIKADGRFKDIILLKIPRLSVQPVAKAEFYLI